MSFSSPINKIQYQGDGASTSFPFGYLVYAATDLVVYGLDSSTGLPTTYGLNTDYTIDPSLLGKDYGVNVVFTDAPASTILITILRQVPFNQPLVLPSGAPLPGPSVEKRLDYAEMGLAQLQEQLSRVPSLPPYGPTQNLPISVLQSDFAPYDTSFGTTPAVSFTPGNVRDSTGGNTIIPNVNNIPITNLPAPQLLVNSASTLLYKRDTIDPSTGEITVSDILDGTAIPSDTSTAAYQLIQNMSVDISGSFPKITFLGGGIRGSQNYFYCGLLPATDGSGHLYNS